jgi:RNA polymerase sigma-70 factor (sigma-E family)
VLVSVEEFETFVVASSPRLLGLARALTSSPHDAWDLVQETLARVGERWDRIEVDHGAYARTVMVRLNIDRVRTLRRELLTAVTPDRPAPEVATDGFDDWLVAGLAELSPRQRTALALRYLEDLDLASIADRMGCSVGTAKAHLYRGTERLRARAGTRTTDEPVEERP